MVTTLASIAVVDLDDTNRVSAHEARQTDTVGAGAPRPRTPRRCPADAPTRAAPRSRHGPPVHCSSRVGCRGRSIATATCTWLWVSDADDDPDSWCHERYAVRHVVGLLHRLTTPSGREGGQDCDGSLSQAPIRSLPTRPDHFRMRLLDRPTDQRKDTKSVVTGVRPRRAAPRSCSQS